METADKIASGKGAQDSTGITLTGVARDEADRNPIFEALVSAEGEISGLVAYSLYKQNKRDWLEDFKKAGRAAADRRRDALLYHRRKHDASSRDLSAARPDDAQRQGRPRLGVPVIAKGVGAGGAAVGAGDHRRAGHHRLWPACHRSVDQRTTVRRRAARVTAV